MSNPSLTPAEYQRWVEKNWPRMRIRGGRYAQLLVMTAGLTGEAGESVEIVKKSVRDGFSIEGKKKRKLCLELGDTLHYLTRIASEYGLTLDDIMRANHSKIEARHKRRQRATAPTKATRRDKPNGRNHVA